MVSGSVLAGLGCLLLLTPSVQVPVPATAAWDMVAAPRLQLVQAEGIKGQDPETAGRGQGNTGWVQAPTPRGQNAPEQAAQGSGAKPADGSGGKPDGAGQTPAGQNPGTPVATPLPGPAGIAPGAPAK
jgi:hypothetical protein